MLQVPRSHRQRHVDRYRAYDGEDAYVDGLDVGYGTDGDDDGGYLDRGYDDGYHDDGYDQRDDGYGDVGYGDDGYDQRDDGEWVASVRVHGRGRRSTVMHHDVQPAYEAYEYVYADPLHPARARRAVARHRRPLAPAERERERFVTMAIAALTVLALAGIAFLGGGGDDESSAGAAPLQVVDNTVAPVAPITAASVPTTELPELDAAASAEASGVAPPPAAAVSGEGCTIVEESLRLNDTGDGVTCLQDALIRGGFLAGPATGTFDSTTYGAVRQVQTERNLFVDGVVGRETAISLGIWPDEQSFVVRTPAPAPGAVDLMGYPLSSVASAGSDAPPLPPNSGSGRRVVYDRRGQRVWAVDDDEQIIRSWLVSGSKYSNEVPGTHQVYSRSEVSTAWNGKAWLPLMIRYYQTDIGHIGFHAIPLHRADNSPYQTEAELGTRLSGGCQRQANADAEFLWQFAQVGTTVVVV
jgi:peptidoglycan hydrolase-like protein with peptidoglycan-binding domain